MVIAGFLVPGYWFRFIVVQGIDNSVEKNRIFVYCGTLTFIKHIQLFLSAIVKDLISFSFDAEVILGM